MVGAKRIAFLTFFVLIVVSKSDNVLGAKNGVVDLNEDNWSLMLEGEWMVEFFAPWCPACKALQPIWADFSGWSEDLGIKVAQVDITSAPGLSGRFIVTALPTIFHVINGEFRLYKGAREKSSFMAYIEEDKWKQTDPVPNWKAPNSFQMGIVAHFFKLSQVLRGIHNTLMEDYGVPTWGSYVIFAVATILVGAILGLVLVCLIDLVYPPRTESSSSKNTLEKQEEETSEEEEEISKEDLIDDQTDEEKISATDSDEQASQGDSPKMEKQRTANSQSNSPTESPNVRKRKTRKDN